METGSVPRLFLVTPPRLEPESFVTDLLSRRPQGFDADARIDRLVSEARQERRRVAAHLFQVQQRTPSRLVRQEDALRD